MKCFNILCTGQFDRHNFIGILLDVSFQILIAGVSIYRELVGRLDLFNFLKFCLQDPFGELVLKITLERFIFREIEKS